MKTIKFLTLVGLLMVTFLSGCLKDPGTPVVTANKSTVAINEEVTLTLSGAENYTCLSWRINSDIDYTIVSGGSTDDITMIIKFASSGISTIEVAVKNCNDGCIGKCRDEYTEMTISVQ